MSESGLERRTSTSLALLLLVLTVISGCGKSDASKGDSASPGTEKAVSKDSKEPAKEQAGKVELGDGQAEKIGLKTATPKAGEYADEAPGYGNIVPHESIAQAVAEVVTAEAADKQSRAALARTRRLAGTAGALSSDVEESNLRQAAVDGAAFDLAKQRLTASLGQDAPWHGDVHAAIPTALAAGTDKLVRVTFPLGTVLGAEPKELRVSHLGGSQPEKRWTVAPVWRAPADGTVPGRSYFGVIRGPEFTEGERVIAWTPVGKARPGVVVPTSAVVISDDKYWCYLAKDDKTFVRTVIDTGMPLEDGYFVTAGITADDHIVVHGAEQLLAQESNTGDADDD
jgi:hypothetical protein